MPSTYLSLHVHVVFGLKDRTGGIAPEWQGRLHGYLGGTVSGVDAIPLAIGGMPDHLHLLLGLRATHRLADVVREVKRASSSWVHDTIGQPLFAWQEGYAAFTVSASGIRQVRAYIANQAAHHRRRSFQEELVAMLEKAGVPYDPRFLPDRA
jgi:REP element-mobilizing transposase RayT